MKKFDVNGLQVNYDDHGNGMPLVLLHGFFGNAEYWHPLLPELTKQYRVLTPEMRGHGGTSTPDESFTVDDLADDVKALLDHLDIEKATIMGHSMGGYTALAFVEKYPERVNAWGLLHSNAYGEDDEGKAARNENIQLIKDHGVEAFIDNLVPYLFAPSFVESHPDIVEKAKVIAQQTTPLGAIHALGAMRDRPNRRHVLQESTTPALVVAGDQDVLISVERSISVEADHITNVVMNGVGHFGMFEAPEKMVGVVTDFLNKAIK